MTALSNAHGSARPWLGAAECGWAWHSSYLEALHNEAHSYAARYGIFHQTRRLRGQWMINGRVHGRGNGGREGRTVVEKLGSWEAEKGSGMRREAAARQRASSLRNTCVTGDVDRFKESQPLQLARCGCGLPLPPTFERDFCTCVRVSVAA